MTSAAHTRAFSSRHKPRVFSLALAPFALIVIAIGFSASAQAAEPPVLREFCPTGEAAGECRVPTGTAVDQKTGEIYVSDTNNYRINKFTAWGEFLRTWGWEVVASGPNDKAPRNEIQRATIDATAGSFSLQAFGGPAFLKTSPIAFNATAAELQSALETASPPYKGFDPGDLSVSGPVGGPWTVEFIGTLANVSIPKMEVVDSTLSGATATATITTVQEGGSPEICIPAQGDICRHGQAGQAGAGGGLGAPRGIAVDSNGDIYVVEREHYRVQKFDPDGNFLLTFGGGVNLTKVEAAAPEGEQNLCPLDPGDVCQSGSKGPGNGQFDRDINSALGSYIAVDHKGSATASDDVVYVGDQESVQKFDAAGHYVGDLPDPDGVLTSGGTVTSLALDQNSGDLYLGFWSGHISPPTAKPGVVKVDSAGGEGCVIAAHNPTAVGVGATDEVYVVEGQFESAVYLEISRYDANCSGREVIFDRQQASDHFAGNPASIATSSACGADGTALVIPNPGINSFVKIFGPAPIDISPPCSPPPAIPPSIEDSFAVSVGIDVATVKARINPHFWSDTRYYVQYGTAQCVDEGGWDAGCVRQLPAGPGAILTESVLDAAVSTRGVVLGGSEALIADTSYRFRFIAAGSGGGPSYGEEGRFRTFPPSAPAKSDCENQGLRGSTAAHLPDCRAYEMVSPLDKNGGDVASPRENVLGQTTGDGEALTYAAVSAFADAKSASLVNQYLAERDPAGGWMNRSINPPRSGFTLFPGEEISPRFKAFSEDLCSGWFLQDSDLALVAGAPNGVMNLYRDRAMRTGCEGLGGYQLLTTIFPPDYDPSVKLSDVQTYYMETLGFSADGEASVFRAKGALSEDACQETNGPGAGVFQLYLSRDGQPGSEPGLVSVLPNGAASCVNSFVGSAQGTGASQMPARFHGLQHAVSANGERIYWSQQNEGKIFLRINASQPQSKVKSGNCSEPAKACTLRVSAEAEALSGTSFSRYLDAAADGSAAFLATGGDLYEYQLSKALADEPAVNPIAGELEGILGASADGSRLYLVSSEDLDQGAVAGEPNLYLYQRAAGFRFIATLRGPHDISPASSIGGSPSDRLSRVTPNGLHAAFVSSDPVLAQATAGYDNRDRESGVPVREIYLYDSTANGGEGILACVSCNPTGARAVGRVAGQSSNAIREAARLPGWTTAMHPGNLLSVDGSRLFFESFEALVPRDTNGRTDVYQWERAGDKAGCLGAIGGELFVPISGGCLSLISSGQSPQDSELIDASADGSDVFFTTGQSLVPRDPGLIDVYDARVGGGFPEPAPAAECEGEACQSPPATPNDPTPASSAFQGAGNVAEEGSKTCKKGKVRRKGRCVKKHRKHKRAAKQTRRAGR